MPGLRFKLALGFGGVLAVMIVVGVLALDRLDDYAGTLQTVFQENYDSVVFGQQVLRARAELDAGATDEAAGLEALRAGVAAAAGNITLEEEKDAIERLQDAHAAYREAVVAGRATAARRAESIALREAADRVIALNLNNIADAEGAVERTAAEARATLYALLAAGVLLALGLVLAMSGAILRPLKALTEGARQIERGDLDLTVPVPGRDELSQLAAAFNAMAARLREFRRTDQAKLLRAQRATEATVNALPDAVALVTPDGTIELANPTARRLFRLYPGQRLETAPVATLEPLRQRALAEGRPVEVDDYAGAVQVFDPPGTSNERFFLPAALPITGDDGEAVGVAVVLADVTHLRRLDEMKSGLLGVASHELKTPLTGLRMAVHLLLQERIGPLNDKQLELLTAARQDAERLNAIIADLLDLGRLQSGRSELDVLPVDPRTLIEEAAETQRSAYAEAGVRLDNRVPDDLPRVAVDRGRLRLVLDNLLGNALRFTPAGGTVGVDARAEAPGTGTGTVRFRVDDEGPGVPDEARHRVFDRFYRAHGQDADSGAGLGLAIAKEVVEAHGGGIGVERADAGGASFWFTLPRAAEPATASARTASASSLVPSPTENTDP